MLSLKYLHAAANEKKARAIAIENCGHAEVRLRNMVPSIFTIS